MNQKRITSDRYYRDNPSQLKVKNNVVLNNTNEEKQGCNFEGTGQTSNFSWFQPKTDQPTWVGLGL